MADPMETVALSSRVLASQGLGDLIWGHSSCRDSAGRGAWIKAAGWGQEEITVDRVHLVSPDGDVVEGDGARHAEYPIHTGIYSARGDVGGVVHSHSPYAVALAASGQPLLPFGHFGSVFVPPDVPRFDATSDLIATPQLGSELAAVLGLASAVFLVNHGMVTVGPTLQAATILAILLERACQQQLLTVAFGGNPTATTPSEAVRKREHFTNDLAVTTVWNYLVRKLPAVATGTLESSEDAR